MRKCLAVWLMLMLLTFPALAEETSQEPLLPQAVALARHLDALAEEESYLKLLTGSETIMALGTAWGEGDHDAPRLVLAAELPSGEAMLDYLRAGGEAARFTEAALAELTRRLPAIMPGTINGMEGAEALAASTALTTSTIFAGDAQGAGMYILLYEHAAPVMVSWYGEQGAVSMQAAFGANEAMADWADEAEAAAWLEERGLPLNVRAVETAE